MLDSNGYVTESRLSLLFILSTFPIESELPSQPFQSCCLKFDEFLAENICSQLVNFHDTRVFRFQSFLLKMFLSHNEDNLQFPKLVLKDKMTQNYCKFMNGLMAEIYSIFFQERFPTVFPKMKEALQLSPSKMIGDWFLSKFETIIRLYGFVHQPLWQPGSSLWNLLEKSL